MFYIFLEFIHMKVCIYNKSLSIHCNWYYYLVSVFKKFKYCNIVLKTLFKTKILILQFFSYKTFKNFLKNNLLKVIIHFNFKLGIYNIF